ncbi:MAG: glycine betaine/L-proline ABC transporter ATP-binding protein [Aestuariivirga sp.]|uniref:quaternary amine ABC transporter ATP-binding protein n=1 Tax=Aestuariivirga sp. TaxID=2650926 RepID=UPI0038CF430C
MTGTAKIACRNLWKVFGEDPLGFLKSHDFKPAEEDFARAKAIGAVRDVSFDVMPGEILIIMGLSGSGKSTLIRAITRLNDPTAGQVLMDGHDLLKASPAELIELRRHKMGMVFQHFGLLPHRTVMSNVAFPLEVRGASREERDARARDMIRLVGLEGREDYFPRELSGGQQQRVGIARSLAVGPDIWFLDEPFSALDPLIRREMQNEFLRLQKMLRKTIVFITHDFDEAVRLGDRIGIMKDGRLVQLATPEDMVTRPADDYVREFTQNAPRDHIVTLAAIALKHLAPGDGAPLSGAMKLAEAAARVLASDRPIAVVGADGAPLGAVTREAMIAALYPEHRP